MDSPLQAFIQKNFDHFLAEAKRLRDRAPLVEYKELVDTLFLTIRKLGTLEHEVAAAKLSSEFKLAAGEATTVWRQIWHDFHRQRQQAITTEKSMAEYDRRTAEIIADLERSYSEMADGDDGIRASMRAAIDAAASTTEAGSNLNSGWRRSAWLILWANLRAFTVYLRYYLAKASFFFFRHAFIFLIPIFVLGFGYSQATKAIIDHLTGLVPEWPRAAAGITFAALVAKQYYFSPKAKKLQTKFESRQLKGLALNLHFVRTLALVSRTLRRSPEIDAEPKQRPTNQARTPTGTQPHGHE